MNLCELPSDLLLHILGFCDPTSAYMCRFLNRTMNRSLGKMEDPPSDTQLIATAARHNHMGQLVWLRMRGYRKNSRKYVGATFPKKSPREDFRMLVSVTADVGLLREILMYSNPGDLVDADVFAVAATLQSHDTLSLLRRYRCPVDSRALSCAAAAHRRGNMKWLRSRGFE